MHRADFATIASWIAPGAQVLDLGCGDGSLLAYLARERNAKGYGVEIADAGVLASVRNGVNVLQNDLESGLAGFDDASFDCVILSQTLQAMRHTEAIVAEMLRVGREVIVTFPNFGHWSHRWQILQGPHAGVREVAVPVVRHAEHPPVHGGRLRRVSCASATAPWRTASCSPAVAPCRSCPTSWASSRSIAFGGSRLRRCSVPGCAR